MIQTQDVTIILGKKNTQLKDLLNSCTYSIGGSYLQNVLVIIRCPIFNGLTASNTAPSSISLTVCKVSIVNVTA